MLQPLRIRRVDHTTPRTYDPSIHVTTCARVAVHARMHMHAPPPAGPAGGNEKGDNHRTRPRIEATETEREARGRPGRWIRVWAPRPAAPASAVCSAWPRSFVRRAEATPTVHPPPPSSSVRDAPPKASLTDRMIRTPDAAAYSTRAGSPRPAIWVRMPARLRLAPVAQRPLVECRHASRGRRAPV
jgi:hypothetical protein